MINHGTDIPGIEWAKDSDKTFRDYRPGKNGKYYYLEPGEGLVLDNGRIFVKSAGGLAKLDEWEGLREKE